MNKLYLFVISFISILVFGCGSSVQSLKVNLKCDGDCNGSNAIVIRIYQLKNSDKFSHASFESLLRNPEATISDDLIPDSKFEITLVPDQTFQLKDYTMKDGAKYIGVVGDFHSPAQDGWRQVIPVNSDIKGMMILIHQNYLSVEKAD
ncbi:MAG: type VI secretion system lipoprotein TssJ [Ignavibacteriaceae bacterium]